MPADQSSTRLVSKTKYAAYVAARLGIGTVGCVLLYPCLLASLICLPVGVLRLAHPAYGHDGFVYLVVGVVSGAVGFIAIQLLKEAVATKPVAPITRYNIAHLPAAESLVRASSAESIPQEQVLLRATKEASETPANELLRSQG